MFKSRHIATEKGFIMPLNITLTNPNSEQETVSIQASANSTSVFTNTITLNAFQTETVPCFFNTSGLAIGNYSYTFIATTTSIQSALPQQATGHIGVTYVPDLNGDFTVNFKDLTTFVSYYITFHNNGSLNPSADFNNDSRLNFNDLVLFVNAYINFNTSR